MSGWILSIDYGTSRVGFAVSDPLHIIATPLKTIKNKSIQDLLKQIQLIVKEYDIKFIVVGLPLGLNGKETKQTETVKLFSETLGKNNYKVIFEDERFTTVLAKKEIIKQKISTGRNKSLIDQVSAAFILRRYLDRKKIFSRWIKFIRYFEYHYSQKNTPLTLKRTTHRFILSALPIRFFCLVWVYPFIPILRKFQL